MSHEQLIIRQSRKKQWSFLLLTGLIILGFFVGPYEKTRIIYKQNPTLTIIVGIIMFGLFFYFLSELVKRKAEIILTKEGIELRDKGFFEWNMIERFWTVHDSYSDNNNEYLILYFKEFADLKFEISHLEVSKEELAGLIIRYKGSASLYFVGHNAK